MLSTDDWRLAWSAARKQSSFKRASMSVVYDVIFSVIAGLPKVYPNVLDVPHSVLQQYEEKLRAPLMHTGTPSA